MNVNSVLCQRSDSLINGESRTAVQVLDVLAIVITMVSVSMSVILETVVVAFWKRGWKMWRI